MGNSIVRTFEVTLNRYFSLIEDIIDICPDKIWEHRLNKSWPIWQLIYHSLHKVMELTGLPLEDVDIELCNSDALSLLNCPDKSFSKEALISYSKISKECLFTYVNSLYDSDLIQSNSYYSQHMGILISHGQTLSELIGSFAFCIGACNSVLLASGFTDVSYI